MQATDHTGPCDDCPLAKRCREQQLACKAFTLFASGVIPKRKWQRLPRVPTHQRYRYFFERDAMNDLPRRVGPRRRKLSVSTLNQGNEHEQTQHGA
jgi:hypothetical protein